MFAVLHGMNMYFLQYSNFSFYKKDDPKQGIYVLIAFTVIIGIVVVFNIMQRNSGSSSGKGGASAGPKRFNAFTIYRIASTYGLDHEQTKLLEFVFRINAANDPERVIRNPALLDRQFKRAYKAIERSAENEEDLQQRLVKLFSLRNIIEAAPGAEAGSPQISANSAAVLVADKESYPVKVISAMGQNVVTEIPRNALGTAVRLSRGTRVTLSFFTRSIKGYSYQGQVVGLQDTEQGPGLQITHTGKATPLVKRKYRRRQTTIRCAFSHVIIDDSDAGKKKAPKLVVDKKRFNGSVLDLSIGGCSIKTNGAIQTGSRLKISIDYDDNYLITVLGQVLRVNRSGPAAIIHVKFLKVPRRAFNSINALVFGFDD